ncbi:hypothetical protein SeMB42_g06519 [Synchytrium endobioticum]|uniref:Uncharacterized protein n=1 Tax=Synchytrium endobioticum TaxID=286115 RepID=A0A507DDM6_9FUNG|nr:hypothetical protein SeMB42_g06519 [Synchytrium endobioticum]TPX48968.1 hypothetical protein SeLEV6574_g01726 [Synchytrium endobioticum]
MGVELTLSPIPLLTTPAQNGVYANGQHLRSGDEGTFPATPTEAQHVLSLGEINVLDAWANEQELPLDFSAMEEELYSPGVPANQAIANHVGPDTTALQRRLQELENLRSDEPADTTVPLQSGHGTPSLRSLPSTLPNFRIGNLS